jgi:hypothetical protein
MWNNVTPHKRICVNLLKNMSCGVTLFHNRNKYYTELVKCLVILQIITNQIVEIASLHRPAQEDFTAVFIK